MKAFLALALLIGGCTTVPADLQRINTEVNHRATYEHYAKRDWRYLRKGDSGNCAAFAFTKYIDLLKAGYKPEIVAYTLWTGEGHAVVTVDGWVLDNRFDQVLEGMR